MPSGIEMFAMYAKERLGKDALITERGFATFEVTGDMVYIEDIYVLPEYRKTHEATKMSEAICMFAKQKHGCTRLRGTVNHILPSASESTKVLLAHGMELVQVTDQFLVFIKEI